MNPTDGEVVVNDQVRGRVVFQNAELDDLVITRSNSMPTYNFSVIVDDFDMGITHVIRGDDHLNNTPRQMNMLAALGVEPPVYAHLPMILGPDGAKLSKRHGAVDIRDYREQGYLPQALLNYLCLLGWSPGDDREVMNLEELSTVFDMAAVSASNPVFDPTKLEWMNGEYIRSQSVDTLAALARPASAVQVTQLSYGPAPAQVLDLYTPDLPAAAPLPTVVLAHGGLWQGGSRNDLWSMRLDWSRPRPAGSR